MLNEFPLGSHVDCKLICFIIVLFCLIAINRYVSVGVCRVRVLTVTSVLVFCDIFIVDNFSELGKTVLAIVWLEM